MHYANGDVYDGEWKADKPQGYGQLHSRLGGFKYVGDFESGLFHGHGKIEYSDGSWYVCACVLLRSTSRGC